MLEIHSSIKERLSYFKNIHKIPNIIFHGPSGCGKRTIVKEFIQSIYDKDRAKIKAYAMYVNCAHGKGIKFIREELKFFAKTHINSNNGDVFKSIILMNADKLTMDAQSALRRCIELFSHNTRFFIVVENKYKLLKPILSRFCEIYVPEPMYEGKIINLYKYNLEEVFYMKEIKKQRSEWLKKELSKPIDVNELFNISSRLYEHGYSGVDLLGLIENPHFMENQLTTKKRYELLVSFNKVRKEFRNEKLLMLFILNFVFVSLDVTLENISFM
jgi:GTPase SAR1 family protein